MAVRQYYSPQGPIYVVSLKSERDKLIREGATVYSLKEYEMVQLHADLIKPLAEVINGMKRACPSLEIVGVRDVRRGDANR
jgi:hypothetical protein